MSRNKIKFSFIFNSTYTQISTVRYHTFVNNKVACLFSLRVRSRPGQSNEYAPRKIIYMFLFFKPKTPLLLLLLLFVFENRPYNATPYYLSYDNNNHNTHAVSWRQNVCVYVYASSPRRNIITYMRRRRRQSEWALDV